MATDKQKSKTRCCLDCAEYVFCQRADKVRAFCDKGFNILWVLAGKPLDEGCKKCAASQKECFKER